MTELKAVGILGLGASLPEEIYENDHFVTKGLETTDEWIQSRTGIEKRRIANPDQPVSSFAIEAAKTAIAKADIPLSEIGLLVLATSSPDYCGFPSTACVVHDALGLSETCAAFDLSAACTGFNYALNTAMAYIQSGQAKYALVIGADCLSQLTDFSDRSTCVIFADGAGAAVVGELESGYGILYSKLYAKGAHTDILKVVMDDKTNFSGEAQVGPTIKMEGRAVYKVAVDAIMTSIESCLKETALDPSEIDYLILHQANLRIIHAVRDRLNLSEDKVIETIRQYGNNSAASIPIAFSDLCHASKLKKGDTILTLGFGAGFTWAIQLIKWQGE